MKNKEDHKIYKQKLEDEMMSGFDETDEDRLKIIRKDVRNYIEKEYDNKIHYLPFAEKAKREENRKIVRDNIWCCNIPLIFKENNFDNFETKTEEQKEAKDICFKYADNFDNSLETIGINMILCGSPGTGKTHLACSIIKHVIEKKESCAKFFTLSKAIRSIKSTWNKNSEENEQQAIDKFIYTDLLILDEVGVCWGSNVEKMLLTEIINERIENMKSTIMISNLDTKLLKESIGERVVDRMQNKGSKFIKFKGSSYRSVK